jgi:hypothetical protein
MTTTTSNPSRPTPSAVTLAADPRLGPLVRKAVAGRSFATLATASRDGRPHVAGVLYQLADGHLWVSTFRSSRKARNIEANPRVALVVPVRRLPVGLPSSVQMQGLAEIVPLDDPGLLRLADAGALDKVTGHGELELPDGCFFRIALPRRVPVHGLGMSLRRLLADPVGAGRIAEVDWS